MVEWEGRVAMGAQTCVTIPVNVVAGVLVATVVVVKQFASCFCLSKSFSHASMSPLPPFRKQF